MLKELSAAEDHFTLRGLGLRMVAVVASQSCQCLQVSAQLSDGIFRVCAPTAACFHIQEGAAGLRSPFSSAAAPSPYPSPTHPFGQRPPTRRRAACEDMLFFDVPVAEVGQAFAAHGEVKPCAPSNTEASTLKLRLQHVAAPLQTIFVQEATLHYITGLPIMAGGEADILPRQHDWQRPRVDQRRAGVQLLQFGTLQMRC